MRAPPRTAAPASARELVRWQDATLHYQGTRAALAAIARELDASRIVEGSVLRLGEQLHVIVRLIDACTGLPVVARSYTGQARTIERMQAAIAWQMADDLAAALRA